MAFEADGLANKVLEPQDFVCRSATPDVPWWKRSTIE